MSPDLEPLVDLLRARRVCVLTGAGCSTESGLPDYRGPGTRERARNPIQYRAFLRSAAVRQRYWARSLVGWRLFDAARPNAAHRAIAALEGAELVSGVITQNVDGLHQAAGSQRVVELHGALDTVSCLACGQREPRVEMQARLVGLNPSWPDRLAEIAPDGDADLAEADVAGFRVAGCVSCGGPLKPEVVFFGENVPRPRVDAAWALFDAADVLLVVGSSLTVFSGYRFVREAGRRGVPVAIVNYDETRGDDVAQVLVRHRAGKVLPALARALVGVGA